MLGNHISASRCHHWQLFDGPFLVESVFACQYSSARIQLHYTNAETSGCAVLRPLSHYLVCTWPRWLVKKKRNEIYRGNRKRVIVSIFTLLSLAFALLTRLNLRRYFVVLIESQLGFYKLGCGIVFYQLQRLLFSIKKWKRSQRTKIFPSTSAKQTQHDREVHLMASHSTATLKRRNFRKGYFEFLYQKFRNTTTLGMHKIAQNGVICKRAVLSKGSLSPTIPSGPRSVGFLPFEGNTVFSCSECLGLTANMNGLFRAAPLLNYHTACNNLKSSLASAAFQAVDPTKRLSYQNLYLRLLLGHLDSNQSVFPSTIYERALLNCSFTRSVSQLINKNSTDTFEYFVKPPDYNVEDVN